MIIFFSSDSHFELFFKTLKNNNIKVDYLFTESPKPTGRNLFVKKNPAHQFAYENNLRVYSADIIDNTFIKKIKSLKPDIGILFAYGKLLPRKFLEAFELGIINLHPSLLPKYRGPSPIQTAILKSENSTGYSFIKLVPKMDAGPILYQEKISILPDDTYLSLMEKIISAAAAKLPLILKEYMSDKIIPTPQIDSNATYCNKISKQDGYISDKDTAESAYNKYRAFINWPKARIISTPVHIIIKKASMEMGKLKLETVQIPGKRPVDINSFKNGYPDLLTKLPDFVTI